MRKSISGGYRGIAAVSGSKITMMLYSTRKRLATEKKKKPDFCKRFIVDASMGVACLFSFRMAAAVCSMLCE